LLSFQWQEETGKQAKCTFEIDNNDLAFFDDESGMMSGGGVLWVSWGYTNRLSPPRICVIKKIKGFSKLIVEAIDDGVELDRTEKVRNWDNVRRSDIANRLAEEHGFGPDARFVDDTEVMYDSIAQTGETDARFLARLARAEGFDFWIDIDGFHFHDQRHDSPSHVFEWYSDRRGTLINISFDVDLTRRVGRSTAAGLTEEQRKIIDESTGIVLDTIAHIGALAHPATTDTTLRDVLSGATAVLDPDAQLFEAADPETQELIGLTRELQSVAGEARGLFARWDIHGAADPDPEARRRIKTQQVARGIRKTAEGVRFPSEVALLSGAALPFSNAAALPFIVNGASDAVIFLTGGDPHRLALNSTANVEPSPPGSAKELQRKAEARYKFAERRSIKMKATTVGDPTIKAGTTVTIKGISQRYSGKYYIRKAAHKITSSGYVCELELTGDGPKKKGPADAPKGEKAKEQIDMSQAWIKDGKVRLKPIVPTQDGILYTTSGKQVYSSHGADWRESDGALYGAGGSFGVRWDETDPVIDDPSGQGPQAVEISDDAVLSYIQPWGTAIGDGDPVESADPDLEKHNPEG
jgi:phage protein D